MKTAVEQLEKQILDNWMDILTCKVNIGDFFEQSKEIEKEQIIESYKAGVWDVGCRMADSEEYYNRTFKQQEQ
jgi:isocitrate dehydrogenase kinase/phosphatase